MIADNSYPYLSGTTGRAIIVDSNGVSSCFEVSNWSMAVTGETAPSITDTYEITCPSIPDEPEVEDESLNESTEPNGGYFEPLELKPQRKRLPITRWRYIGVG